ncbi:MAG: SPFH domain-containing protein, partial [Propionibacteriaceae bacterium]|nr:SPFH domain-containing protein [Propionibacteriaceae bacterium]
ASQRLDFTVLPERGDDATDGREQASAVLTRLAQSLLVASTGRLTMNQVVGQVDQARELLARGFEADQRLKQIGIEVVDLHVLAIRAPADLEKALQTPLREQIQSDADKATYERRALAVERERTISENELASKIELAARTNQLVEQEGANARLKAETEAAAELITSRGQAEQHVIAAQAEADSVRLGGEADAQRQAALMASYSGVDIALLRALALRDLAQSVHDMTFGDITITPDLLSKALQAWKA